MDNETDNLMDKDDRAYSCCNCGIDCGAFPEVWISLGGEVAIHSCFCSGECFFDAVEKIKEAFMDLKLKGESA